MVNFIVKSLTLASLINLPAVYSASFVNLATKSLDGFRFTSTQRSENLDALIFNLCHSNLEDQGIEYLHQMSMSIVDNWYQMEHQKLKNLPAKTQIKNRDHQELITKKADFKKVIDIVYSCPVFRSSPLTNLTQKTKSRRSTRSNVDLKFAKVTSDQCHVLSKFEREFITIVGPHSKYHQLQNSKASQFVNLYAARQVRCKNLSKYY